MSSVFPDWQKYAVQQRRPRSGCIPTCFEMILRSVHARNVDFATFQDDFDLDQSLPIGKTPRNNYCSLAAAVKRKYPNISFHRIVFKKGKGNEKLKFVEDRLAMQHPILVSIANIPFGGDGWHIMPVVDATADDLILLVRVETNGALNTRVLRKDEFIRIHDHFDGGDDVAYLEKW